MKRVGSSATHCHAWAPRGAVPSAAMWVCQPSACPGTRLHCAAERHGERARCMKVQREALLALAVATVAVREAEEATIKEGSVPPQRAVRAKLA